NPARAANELAFAGASGAAIVVQQMHHAHQLIGFEELRNRLAEIDRSSLNRPEAKRRGMDMSDRVGRNWSQLSGISGCYRRWTFGGRRSVRFKPGGFRPPGDDARGKRDAVGERALGTEGKTRAHRRVRKEITALQRPCRRAPKRSADKSCRLGHDDEPNFVS